MNGGVMQIRENGTLEPVQSPIGSDAHRIDTARWALETFDPTTAIYKQALKVMAAYLAGKPLPQA